MKTLEQEVRTATDDRVNGSRLRVRTKANEIDSELNKFTLSEHITVISLLETMCKHRQQEMQLAAAEMQRQHGLEQQERADKARAAMEQRAKMQVAKTPEELVGAGGGIQCQPDDLVTAGTV